MMLFPSRFHSSTPVGCVAGFFWLLLAGVDVFCFWIAYAAHHADPAKLDIGRQFLIYGIILGAILFASLALVFKLCITADKRRPGVGNRGMTR